MKWILLVIFVFLFTSCKERLHITSWQEPVFLNDSTLIIIGWEEDRREGGVVSAPKYSNGKQTLYHYNIHQKTLQSIRTLQENDMGASSQYGVKLQYPWILYASRTADDEEFVELLNLETGEKQTFTGEAANPLFVTRNGRFVGYHHSGTDYAFDRKEQKVVFRSTRTIPMQPLWVDSTGAKLYGSMGEANGGPSDQWLCTFSLVSGFVDTLNAFSDSVVTKTPPLMMSSGLCQFYSIANSDTGTYIATIGDYADDAKLPLKIAGAFVNTGTDINTIKGLYVALQSGNVLFGNYLENTLETILTYKSEEI